MSTNQSYTVNILIYILLANINMYIMYSLKHGIVKNGKGEGHYRGRKLRGTNYYV